VQLLLPLHTASSITKGAHFSAYPWLCKGEHRSEADSASRLRSGLAFLPVGWGESLASWSSTQEHAAMLKAGTILLAMDSVIK